MTSTFLSMPLTHFCFPFPNGQVLFTATKNSPLSPCHPAWIPVLLLCLVLLPWSSWCSLHRKSSYLITHIHTKLMAQHCHFQQGFTNTKGKQESDLFLLVQTLRKSPSLAYVFLWKNCHVLTLTGHHACSLLGYGLWSLPIPQLLGYNSAKISSFLALSASSSSQSGGSWSHSGSQCQHSEAPYHTCTHAHRQVCVAVSLQTQLLHGSQLWVGTCA